mgnify:CR=1 FL=1
MIKLRAGDQVLVTTGRDKGKRGKVEKVLVKEKKVVILGIGVYKRHKKATATQKAGIYETTRPIDTSKVAVVCPKCSKQTRVAFKVTNKQKQRICTKCKGAL